MFTSLVKNIFLNEKSYCTSVAKLCFKQSGLDKLQKVWIHVSCPRAIYHISNTTNNMTNRTGPRSICFADYDVVGFDCDHTLAQYNLYNLFKDTYEIMARYLVNEKGYEKRIFKFSPNLCSRGIILDLEKGNFMKLSHDGRILRAFHGTRPIPNELYEKQIWPHHEELSRSMTNIGTKYRIFENFFDMASSILCAQMIDFLDEKHDGRPGSYNVWPDVSSAIRHVYLPEEFRGMMGPFYSEWSKDAARYVERGSDGLKDWLKKMKAGRPMFVLSSAYEDVAAATLSCVLGDEWHEYFDLSIFLAEKPGFFNKRDPFYRLSQSYEKNITNLKNNKYIFGGNLEELNKHFASLTGKPKPKVLYFGDSQRSDIIPSKSFAKWDTVHILEEMACETCFYEHRGDNLKKETCDFGNPCVMPWGSIFIDNLGAEDRDDRTNRKVQTLVHSVIRKYSDIAVPNIQFLFDYPLDHQFTTFEPQEDSSLSGFHPFHPHSLE